jgi:hypothetical protein
MWKRMNDVIASYLNPRGGAVIVGEAVDEATAELEDDDDADDADEAASGRLISNPTEDRASSRIALAWALDSAGFLEA